MTAVSSSALSLVAVAAVMAACGQTAPHTAAKRDVPPVEVTRERALPEMAVVGGVAPAVVDIVTTRSLGPGAPEDEGVGARAGVSRRPPHKDLEFTSRELGSGFVIRPDGYILTSAHVVDRSEEVVVRFPNSDRELSATVVGLDHGTDVALLRVGEATPATVKFGASRDLRVGDWVAAIGAPFGFSNTITAGVVSATHRTLPDESLVSFIQTDVAINPGNSGGPLLNLRGEVVGLNSVIYSRTGGYMGVSFAVPIEVALDVSEKLRNRGHVRRGHIGVQAQALTEKLARSFAVPESRGVLVAAVEEQSPAARSRVEVGDVILAYNATRVASIEQWSRLVADSVPGSTISVEIWRDGERRPLLVDVAELPQPRTPPPRQPSAHGNRLGLVFGDLPPPLRRHIGLEAGLLVEDARGAANVAGVLPGDIVTTVNRTPVKDVGQFDALLAVQPPGAIMALRVIRSGDAIYVAVKVPD